MAKPQTAAPPGVAATGPDVLLATKLHLPHPQADLVPRPRLTEALDKGMARALIVVSAPASRSSTEVSSRNELKSLGCWLRAGRTRPSLASWL
jgi:hypothetical protein